MHVLASSITAWGQMMTNEERVVLFVSPTLYTYDSKGKVREWRCWAEDDSVFVSSGLKDGKKAIKEYKAKPKNVGRSNETSAEEQAILESKAKWNKQLDKNYHLDLVNYIPLENPMLAYPYKDKKHKLEFPCHVQPKLDGVRCLIKLEGSEVVYKSRGNKLYTTLGHLDKNVRALLEKLPEGVMLDGEIYCHGMPLNEINSAVKKLNENTKNLKFYWYDITDASLGYTSRWVIMAKMFCDLSLATEEDSIVFTETRDVGGEGELAEIFAHYIEEGYEGIMLRNAKGKYSLNNRSVDLQKYKEFDDDEFMIVGHKLDKDGRIVLVCEAKNKQTFDVVTKGGHKFREQVLKEYESKWWGKWLKVQFQGYGVNGVPIFPVGLGLRETDEEGNVL